MIAYYNEIDPFAAQWLENLSAAGLILPGYVDHRSIRDLTVNDVSRFRQCHFFAGIGGWSYALRLAGIADDAPVWTGSCPCQPFSTAGKQRGTADERHLWPEWFRLIRECRPPVVFGEQVASPAGRAWFAAVRADLEAVGYAVGAADLCAAGVSAPHLRQRLYFGAVLVGAPACDDERRQRLASASDGRQGEAGGSSAGMRGLGNAAHGDGRRGERGAEAGAGPDGERRRGLAGASIGHLADTERRTAERQRLGMGAEAGAGQGAAPERERLRADAEHGGDAGWLADADGRQPRDGTVQRGRGHAERAQDAPIARPIFPWAEGGDGSMADDFGNGLQGDGKGRAAARAVGGSGETNPWAACVWLPCRDGKWRPAPLERQFQPLAARIPSRVGRLRGYGNAIVPQIAATFVRAFLEATEVARVERKQGDLPQPIRGARLLLDPEEVTDGTE